MDGARQRVVIVGGGFGGLRTALHLAKRRAYDVVLIDQSDVHVYTPWLYEVASGRTDGMPHASERALRHSAGLPLTQILGRTNVQVRKATVTGVDVETRHVLFVDGSTLSYDALVLAPGSATAYFGIEGLEEHALTLKSIHSAEQIHQRVRTALQTVLSGGDVHIMVGGAGPSGVELIAELATMVRARERRGTLPRGHVRFSLVDAGGAVLSVCSPWVSRKSEQRLRALGVHVFLDTMVTGASAHSVTLAPRPRTPKDTAPSRASITASTTVPCTFFVWCGGVVPSPLTAALALPKDARGRVQVDPTFEVAGHANIFALGDVATWADAAQKPAPQTAQVADAVAVDVAANVMRALSRRALLPSVLPKSWPFVLTIGGRYGVADVWGVHIAGVLAYGLRRGADLRYLMCILPLRRAYRVWRSRMKLYAEND